LDWSGTESTRTEAIYLPIVRTLDEDEDDDDDDDNDNDDCGAIGGMDDCQRRQKYSEKTCPSAVLSTTDPKLCYLDSNPGRRGGKPATNRLSYDIAADKDEICFFSRASKLDMGPTQSRVHCVLVGVSLAAKRSGCEDDHPRRYVVVPR
jgi:hypothetical protein